MVLKIKTIEMSERNKRQKFHETTFTYNYANSSSLRRRIRHFTNTGAYSPVEQTGAPVYIFITFSETLSLHVVVRKIYKDINDH